MKLLSISSVFTEHQIFIFSHVLEIFTSGHRKEGKRVTARYRIDSVEVVVFNTVEISTVVIRIDVARLVR